MRAIGAIPLVLLIMSYDSLASAHGVVGEYVFLEPLITEDPTPANELDILQPSWVRSSDANNYSIGLSMEKVLYIDDQYMPRLSVGGGSGWNHVSPFVGHSTQGFDNLELFGKYAFYYSLQHEFMLTIEAKLQLPTGNKDIESQNHTSLGPAFLWEKGMGDLPNWSALKYFRPFGIQSDFGYLPALGVHPSHDMFADAVVEYSLPYLSNNVRDIGLRWPLRNLYLFNEINYGQLITGPPGQTFPTLLATPGLAYVSYHFELALGTQFALNNASIPGTHAAVLGLLDIFYDSIIPHIGNWTIKRFSRMSRRALVLIGNTLVASIVGAAAATSAHSFPEQETPSAGATLTAPPTQVNIKYDAPIEKLFASLEVLNSTGQNVAMGQPEVSPDGWNLSVRVNNLQPGEYTVQWRVVCIDTHHTQGSYSFTVERPNS